MGACAPFSIAADNGYTEVYKNIKLEVPEFTSHDIATSELEECRSAAREHAAKIEANSAILDSLYGRKVQELDHFGGKLISCLTEERPEKPWAIFTQKNGEWSAISARDAMIKTMGSR